MVAKVPYRNRRTTTREGKRLQEQVQRVADAVTGDRVAAASAQRVFVGMTIIVPTGAQPSAGWLGPLDGTLVPRRQAHPEVFALIGETFGAGDGATTFDLPDLSAWVPPDHAAYLFSGR